LATLGHWIQRNPDVAAPTAEPLHGAPPPPLAALPGVDLEPALARLRGDVRQYRKLMQRFGEAHTHTTDTLAQLLEAGAHADAQRLAHTLKGLAANLGATALREAAQALEHALDAGAHGQLGALQAQLHASLQPLLEAVAAELASSHSSGTAPAPTATRPDPAWLRQQLQQLAALLARDDADAGPLSQSLVDALRGQPEAEGFAPVAAHAKAYDFDAALLALQALAQTWALDLKDPAA
jgi:two-component system sensor histidine kinase/response regulator